MSYSYDRYETRRRQTSGVSTRRTGWGHWIPLAITVTVATAGIAAWIWNERRSATAGDDDNDENEHPPGPPPPGHGGPPPGPGYGPPPGAGGSPPQGYGPPQGGFPNAPPSGFDSIPPGQSPYARVPGNRDMEEEGIVSRMSGALRRTPSPQQIIDGASRRVAAGVAAAGAAVGGALASIREEDRRDYEDHSRWSEEAESQNGSSRKGPELRDAEAVRAVRQAQAGLNPSSTQKTVAIVVSAETDYEHEADAEYHQEHASILSHLPDQVDRSSRVFVLIYDHYLKEHPLSFLQSEQRTHSIASSFSNIGHEDAQSRGEGSPSPKTSPLSKMFTTLYTQAQAIVEKDIMIMPFTTPTGFVHMLRHLGPETVYLQATLAGSHGENMDPIKNWVGQIVLVVGDESGHGGLVDSEDERGEHTKNKWWLEDARIGLGKGIEVVESLRVGEDFKRRVGSHD
ncbi:MAG: hypothetical protein Q9217_003173 [Psora testacea]